MRAIFSAYRQSLVVLTMLGCFCSPAQAASLNLAPEPLFLSLSQPPLVMLTLSRDHKVFTEAYNDYVDLDGDGVLDLRYKPGQIDYYGYFDSYKCYDYLSTAFTYRIPNTPLDQDVHFSGYFSPVTVVNTPNFTKADGTAMNAQEQSAQRLTRKDCTGHWSGDWLNYVTASKMDTLLKVLYGGSRVVDSTAQTILGRSLIPTDGHAWAKEYQSIVRDGYDISKFTPYSVPSADNYHLFANVTLGSLTSCVTVGCQNRLTISAINASPPLLRVLKNTPYRAWDWMSLHQETGAVYPAAGNLCGSSHNACGTPDDFNVAVEVCTVSKGLEANCRGYGDTPIYKPDGLLQSYGQNDSMYFGGFLGSYTNNTRGGYLTGRVISVGNEINSSNGILTNQPGNVLMMQKVRVMDFDYSSNTYAASDSDYSAVCPELYDGQMTNMMCGSWGNPVGEMIAEVVRYFAGQSSPGTGRQPTPMFVANGVDSQGSHTFESSKGITASRFGWRIPNTAAGGPNDPYRSSGGYPYCAKPYILAISDVNPSFDSDALPGSNFCLDENDVSYPCDGAKFGAGDLPGFTMGAYGQAMWNLEFSPGVTSSSLFGPGPEKQIFIGQSGSNYNGIASPKTASSFGSIRGLASEPSRQGSYASAIAAYYAHTHDLNLARDKQAVSVYALALPSLDPKIEIPMGAANQQKIEILPFAKTVYHPVDAAQASDFTVSRPNYHPTANFRPTNQITDFYVESIVNTSATDADATVNGGRPSYRLRIYYTAVEQGGFYQPDAMVIYEVNKLSDTLISVSLVAQSVGSSLVKHQHLGYVISSAKEVSPVLSAQGAVLSTCDIAGASNSIYLDVLDTATPAAADVAHGYYAYDTRYDTAVTSPSVCITSVIYPAVQPLTVAMPTSRTRYFRLDTATSAVTRLHDPLWYMAKYGGFNDDNGNQIPDSTEWDANGDGVPDNYFPVTNPLNLQTQMSAALSKIAKDSGTAAALASNSTSLRSTLMLYQARFSSDGWGGELNAYPVLANGDLNAAQWSAQYVMAAAATKLNPSTRVVLSYDPQVSGVNSRGIPFRWNSMTSSGTLQSELNKAWSAAGTTVDGRGSKRVDFLRGADATESLADGTNYFRTRPCIPRTSGASCITNYLGDIINSAPQFVGAPTFGYVLPGYKAFYDTWKARTAMVYVGANDGMLHGFDATTGVEKIAYVPSALYRGAKLSRLPASDYGVHTATHAFYVDGAPTFGDVCGGSCATAGDWHTLVVGGLGGGGQGIYALDVTDPSQFSEANASSLVKWEFNDTDSADLGYTYSRPAIVRLCTTRNTSSTAYPQPCTASRWVVVFGSGYNNDEADGAVTTDATTAHLFILDALTGALLRQLTTTSVASPNGLATVAPVDVDADGIVDFAYGADLQGNMWKFDLATVAGANIPYALYQAKTGSGESLKVQAITTTPEVMAHPNGGTLVLFATGKYLENVDKTTKTQQTVYGIWDKLGAVSGVPTLDSRSNLLQQSLISGTQVAVDGTSVQQTSTVIDSETNEPVIIQKARFLATTNNTPDWSNQLGWYLDLQSTANFLSATPTAPSERVAYDMQLGNQVLNVSTILPTNDVCAYGGDSWNYSLNPLTGGRPIVNEFIGAPQVTLGDGTKVYTNARSSTVGISPPGTIITLGRGQGVLYQGGSTGAIEKISIQIPYGLGRRLSWRELESD